MPSIRGQKHERETITPTITGMHAIHTQMYQEADVNGFLCKIFRRKEDLLVAPGETWDGYPHSPRYPCGKSLDGHALIIGGREVGKTALISQLAAEAIQRGDALIALDMDGDLIAALLPQIPRGRFSDVAWLQMTDPAALPGFNALDVSHGEPTNLIVENVVRTAPLLWGSYWAPGVEDALAISVRTLVAANRVLVERHEPQFTLLDIHQLFDLPKFCKKLLDEYVRDEAVVRWWSGLLDRRSWLNRDDYSALITPLERFSGSTLELNLGQSESSLKLQERLWPGRITLIDLSAPTWDTKLRAWFRALLADRIYQTILTREPALSHSPAHSMVVAIDGHLELARVDEPGLLADLHERGARCVLTNLAAPAVIAGANKLFVFGTSRSFAEGLAPEFGREVAPDDLEDLASCEFYARTIGKNHQVHVSRYSTCKPLKTNDPGKHAIQRGIVPSGVREAAATEVRRRFWNRWYGRLVTELVRDAEQARSGD